MYKLGDFCEDDAKSIAEYLRKAGIKVELKPSIDASIETDEFLQGRLSDLKADIENKDIIETYERYLSVLKNSLLLKPSPEDLEEIYLKELFPTIDENRKKLKAMLKEDKPGEGEGTGDNNEQNDKIQEIMSDLAKLFIKAEDARAFAMSVLSLNHINPGEDIGDRLDDPVVAMPVDLDDFGIEHPRAKRVITTFLTKRYDLYVDEFSVIFADRLDEEFIRRYTQEHLKIASFNLLLTDLIENHSSEKMDFETFEDECQLVLDSKNRTLRVSGYPVAEEIAKVLEKNGLIKIKGDVIRWKK
jgi:hypothetical protein